MKKNKLLTLIIALISVLGLTGCVKGNKIPVEPVPPVSESSDISDISSDISSEINSVVENPDIDYDDEITWQMYDELVKFSEIKYNHPSPELYASTLDEIINTVKTTTDKELAAQKVNEASGIINHFTTMLTYASIKHDLNPTDAHWADEYNSYNDEYYSMLYHKHDALFRAIYVSPVASYLGETFGITIPDDPNPEPDYDVEEYTRLQNNLQGYINEYYSVLNTATVTYYGQDYLYNDINSSPLTAADYKALLKLWCDTYNEKLGNIYINIVKARNEIARFNGYSNYAEYHYATDASTGYSVDDVNTYIKNIVKYLSPVHEKISELGAYYNPQVTVKFDDLYNTLMKIFGDFGASFDQVLELAKNYELYDITASSYKHSEYTTYLTGYDVPFLTIAYKENPSSVGTFIHEFGHFYSMYMTYDQFSYSYDINEINSQALELLVSRHYDSLPGVTEGDAYKLEFDALSGVFMDINEQAFYTYFENIVYNTDEDKLTVDFLNDLAEKCSTELSIYDKEYPDNLKRNWVTITHLIDYPFYTFSYVTSADTALQIWEISLSDEQKAIDTYTAILRSGSYSYIDVLKDAGIESPFSEQRMQRLAKLMTKYLVDEEW